MTGLQESVDPLSNDRFTLRPETKSRISALLDAATKSPKTQIPGLVAAVTNRHGDDLFTYSSGVRNVDKDEPMTTEVIFWIASCTKLITAIACMQLVEQNKLTLDDPDLVSKSLPELTKLGILSNGKVEKDESSVVQAGGNITVRMLLTHTSGLGYTTFNPEIREYMPDQHSELSGHIEDLSTPLLFKPGTSWNYGINIDWLGILIERTSGLRLNDYFQKHIFQPLNLTDMTMFPDAKLQQRLSTLHNRDLQSGEIHSDKHVLQAALTDSNSQCLGGTGIFAPPVKYVQILATLLNGGVSPKTNNRILRAETVQQMFKPQVPGFSDFADRGIHGGKPNVMHKIDRLSLPGQNGSSDWGFAGVLQEVEYPDHKGKGVVAWWCGLSNLYWWCDQGKGVAGIVATQILPFWDPQMQKIRGEMFDLVYQN